MFDANKIQEEYAKCYSDKSRIYLIQSYLKTYDATQSKDVPFHMFPKQQEFCITLSKGCNCVLKKPRQSGITTTCGAFLSGEILFAEKDEPITILCIGNTLDLAQQMLNKIRDFSLQYPAWLWGDNELIEKTPNPMEPPSKRDLFKKCNDKELIFFNNSRVVARSSGPHASRGVGGVQFLVFDEAAFIEKGDIVYSSAIPTVSTGGHIIMISTPNGKDALYYKTCKLASQKGSSTWNNYELVELRWYQDSRYNKRLKWVKKDPETGEVTVQEEPYLDKEGNVKYDPERWEQLEKDGWEPTSPWYVKMCQQFNNDTQKIAQELDVSFLGSAANVVAPEFIEMQEKLNAREPLKDLKDPFVEDTWFWKAPIEGHRYIMAIDCSRGDAADRTAIEIIDMDGRDENGMPIIEQVAEYHGKKTGDEIGEIAYQYGRMYGNAFTVVDCIGGTGDACVLTLMNLGYGDHLYYDDVNLSKYLMKQEATALKTGTDGRMPGFHTQSVRFQMLSSFANLVKTNGFKIRSMRVINELDTWIYKGTQARMDHMDGFHDDTITCLAMGLFVMEFSFNKIERAQKTDTANMQGFLVGNQIRTNVDYKKGVVNVEVTKKYAMPFITGNNAEKDGNPYSWLIK